ncbi:MAG: hypothetical protein ABJB55_07045 [Actinomycetota bacterium]
MAELRACSLAVVVCAADADALDALVAPGYGARVLRTAADEALFVTAPEVVADVAREVADRIAALDDDAIVLDVTDGWAAWSLAGDDAERAFSYLSHLEAPANRAFVQGDVAHVGAKVLGEPGCLTILVPAYWREHLRERAVHDARAHEVRP